jgi:hypothetical protein
LASLDKWMTRKCWIIVGLYVGMPTIAILVAPILHPNIQVLIALVAAFLGLPWFALFALALTILGLTPGMRNELSLETYFTATLIAYFMGILINGCLLARWCRSWNSKQGERP